MGQNGREARPREPKPLHPAVAAMLEHFDDLELSGVGAGGLVDADAHVVLQDLRQLAEEAAYTLSESGSAEVTVGLRKLLEAHEAFGRAGRVLHRRRGGAI